MHIRDFIKKHKYTQVDVADLFGVSRQLVKYWMNNGFQVTGKKGQRKVFKTKVVATEKGFTPVEVDK